MSDNVAITPGLGTSVRTEDQGGVQVQIISVGNRITTPFSEVAINVASSGDNTIIAAGAAGVKHRLYGFFLSVNGAVNLKWKDGAASDFHPVQYFLGQGASWFMPRDGNPWFTGTAATALILNLSAAIQVSGRAYYVSAT